MLETILWYILLFVFLFGSNIYLGYDSLNNSLREYISIQYVKNMSSVRARGSGMVINPKGGVMNAVSTEECQRRADIAIDISDKEIKTKVYLKLLEVPAYITAVVMILHSIFFK